MTPGPLPATRDACLEADAADPLRALREQYLLPDGVIYLDGNSLGALPRQTPARVAAVIEGQWGADLIASWNAHGWFELPVALGDLLAPLIGAAPGEVAITDSTSINLFKVLAAALSSQREDAPERRVIVSERDNFPTDLYIAEGLAALLDDGYELRLTDDALALEDALDGDVAVCSLSHVNYRTGAMRDLEAVTRLAHDRGALMIWDLAHSAGAVPVDLAGAGADYAVGCTYKYLNGGPGAPAFLWVPERLQGRGQQPLSGWWGHARPFAMTSAYEPAADIRRFLCGTQPITALAAVRVGLELIAAAGIDALRTKSLALTDLVIARLAERCAAHPLELVTPREHARRGSQVSVRHPAGYAVMAALIDRGVIGDYREPEVLRLGIAPSYVGYTDVWDAIEVLGEILDTRAWDAPRYRERATVT